MPRRRHVTLAAAARANSGLTGLSGHSRLQAFDNYTPWKINMEHTNHPFFDRKMIFQTSMRTCSMLIFRGVSTRSLGDLYITMVMNHIRPSWDDFCIYQLQVEFVTPVVGVISQVTYWFSLHLQLGAHFEQKKQSPLQKKRILPTLHSWVPWKISGMCVCCCCNTFKCWKLTLHN